MGPFVFVDPYPFFITARWDIVSFDGIPCLLCFPYIMFSSRLFLFVSEWLVFCLNDVCISSGKISSSVSNEFFTPAKQKRLVYKREKKWEIFAAILIRVILTASKWKANRMTDGLLRFPQTNLPYGHRFIPRAVFVSKIFLLKRLFQTVFYVLADRGCNSSGCCIIQNSWKIVRRWWEKSQCGSPPFFSTFIFIDLFCIKKSHFYKYLFFYGLLGIERVFFLLKEELIKWGV